MSWCLYVKEKVKANLGKHDYSSFGMFLKGISCINVMYIATWREFYEQNTAKKR